MKLVAVMVLLGFGAVAFAGEACGGCGEKASKPAPTTKPAEAK